MHAHSGKTAARRAGAIGAGRFRTGGGLSVAPPAGYRHSADERPCLHSDAFLPGAHSLRRHAPQPEAARGALREAVLSHRERHDQPEGDAPLPVFRGRADRGAAPQSVTDLSTVEYAILETDGTHNVILTPAERPVTAGQLRCAEPETGYPYILISDGTVLRENLHKCGKTEEWLRGECRRQGVKSPEQVFLLTCDTTGNVYFAKREKRP